MTEKPSSVPPPKLLDQVRGKIRVKHYSIRTEQSYVDWIKRFIRFHGKRHPKDMDAQEVEAFLKKRCRIYFPYIANLVPFGSENLKTNELS